MLNLNFDCDRCFYLIIYIGMDLGIYKNLTEETPLLHFTGTQKEM